MDLFSQNLGIQKSGTLWPNSDKKVQGHKIMLNCLRMCQGVSQSVIY